MGLERGFCNCLLSFLRTHLDGLLDFQLNPDLTEQLRDYVNQQIPTNTLESDRPQVFMRFMQGNNSVHDINNNEFFTQLHLIVIEATVLPLSALTNLFHQRFSKHRYLKLTLELLQQFYILIEYHITKFNVFPGDLNQFCLRCARCRRRVSTIVDIGTTLKNALMAMLMRRFIHSHGNNADDDSDGSKIDVLYSSLPLLFSTQETYDKSLSQLEHSTDDLDECLYYDILCSKEHHGKYRFYKAVKVGINQVSESNKFINKKHQKTTSSTVSRVKAIFEEVLPAIDIHKRIAARDLYKKVIDPALTMFNNYDKNAPGSYFFEQGPIYGETNTSSDKDLLKVLEGWCLFFHREAYKNFLCALVHVSKMVYKTKGIIHEDVYANLSKEIEMHHMTRKDAIARKLGIPFGYNVEMDNNNYVVSASNLCPNQFPLGKIATMAATYETKGSGWGMVTEREYFWSSNPRDDDKTQKQMTTTKEFKFAHTLLSTMSKIRVLMSDKKI